MLSWAVILGSAAAAGTAMHRAIGRRRDRRRRELIDAWLSTSQRLGLSLDTSGPLRMHGNLGSIAVRVETATESNGGGSAEVTRFHLEDSTRVPLTFRMRRRARTGWFLEEIEKNGMVTGDPLLDALTVVRGNEVRLAAVLNQKARDLIKLAVGMHGAAIGYGRVTHRELGHLRSERRLVSVLHMLRDLCEIVSVDDEQIPSALYLNLSDPLEGIRRRNFQLLFEYFPDSSEARQAQPLASADPDPLVRLSAALGLGIDGLPEIVSSIDDPYVAASIKIYAIRQLALRYRGAIVEQTLRKLLGSHLDPIVCAALRAIAASQKRELLQAVVDLLRDPMRNDEVLVDAVATLGAIGDAAIERELVGVLDNPSVRVRIAVAYALGGVGTLASIEHLMECSSGLFTHRALKETSRRAIRRIQERFGGAEAGGLSLVEGEERGDLSMPPGPEGALSFD